jgi:putative ABC transport system substrate-binding protein
MTRRQFIKLLGGAVVMAPVTARAQQATTVQTVGYLTDESPTLGSTSFEIIAKALSQLGYVEGHNITFEPRYAGDKNALLPRLAAELVLAKVNVIVAVGTPATRAAENATATIPIIFSRISDLIALGLVQNLARPGGNLTGVSVISHDLAAKRLELLVQFIPGIRRVGVLWDPTFQSAPLELKEIERAAASLNIDLTPLAVQRAEQIEAAVHDLMEQRGQALYVVPGLLFTELRQRVAEIAIKNRIPTMLSRKENVEAGGLMSYGPNYADMYRRAASYVDRILKGAKPSDLPVEEPNTVELVINLKTAKAIGIMVPQSLLVAADEVIE